MRSLTLRVDHELWRRWAGAPAVPQGDTFEILTYGDAVINGETVRFTPAGEVAFEVGTTYVVPIFEHQGRFSPMAEASFAVSETSQIVLGDQRGDYVATLEGASVSDFQDLLLASDPYPASEGVLEGDWQSRLDAFRRGDFGPA